MHIDPDAPLKHGLGEATPDLLVVACTNRT